MKNCSARESLLDKVHHSSLLDHKLSKHTYTYFVFVTVSVFCYEFRSGKHAYMDGLLKGFAQWDHNSMSHRTGIMFTGSSQTKLCINQVLKKVNDDWQHSNHITQQFWGSWIKGVSSGSLPHRTLQTATSSQRRRDHCKPLSCHHTLLNCCETTSQCSGSAVVGTPVLQNLRLLTVRCIAKKSIHGSLCFMSTQQF